MSRSYKRHPSMRPMGPRSAKRWKRWEAKRRRRLVHAVVASSAPEAIDERLHDTRRRRFVRGDAIEIRWCMPSFADLEDHLRWLASQGVSPRALRRQFKAMTKK